MEQLLFFDKSLFKLVNQEWTNIIFDHFFPVLTNLHYFWWFRFLILPAILGFWFYKQKKKAVKIFFVLAIAGGIADAFSYRILKKHYKRVRPNRDAAVVSVLKVPYGPKSPSFPSNHAFTSFTVATLISKFYPVAAPVVFTIASLTAYSRVYVGVHYPVDVSAGALFGLALGTLVWWTLKFFGFSLAVNRPRR